MWTDTAHDLLIMLSGIFVLCFSVKGAIFISVMLHRTVVKGHSVCCLSVCHIRDPRLNGSRYQVFIPHDRAILMPNFIVVGFGVYRK